MHARHRHESAVDRQARRRRRSLRGPTGRRHPVTERTESHGREVDTAEDEEGLPDGWLPHATECHGYASGTNSVSLVFANGVTNILRRGAQKETMEEDAVQGLYRTADFMRTPNLLSLGGYIGGTPGILMIPRVVAQALYSLGWTKKSIREFLWQHSRIPMWELRRNGGTAWIEINSNPATRESIKLDPWPITAKPENLVLVVAGGGQPSNSYWLQGYCSRVIGREIRVPPSFDSLLADANRDLAVTRRNV